jgi:GT2 family glycosyltransferase
MKLTVVIVNYNVRHYLYQCLESLYRALNGIDAEVYVVDNHSRDGSVNYVSKRFKNVNYVESNHNLGFARANNIAIRQSEGEYILLLNPDTIVGEDTIHHVLDFMDAHPGAGGAGVRMLKSDGTKAMESRRGLPTPMTSFYKMSGLCKRFPNSRRFGHYYMSYLPWDNAVQIEIISGAFCMLRKSAIEQVGLLDEDFFMYGEDIDLSCRLIKGGYQNWYLPETILHYKGESTQKSSFRYVHVFYEAMMIFFKKHYGSSSLWLTIPIKMAIYLKAFMALVKMQTTKIKKTLGFFSPRRKREPDYIFIGSSASIAQCRKLAKKKGLSGEFYVANENTNPDGHLSMLSNLDTSRNSKYIVYDIEAFQYKKILDIFARRPIPNVYIGTYNPKVKTIITAEEILR